jgi:Zn-dependent membrane protease YugP
MLALPLLLFGPQLWVQVVLRRHSEPRADFPGTGGEFARHLLTQLGLESVNVEPTDAGDHYDPASRTVRLTADRLYGKSLTAVVVAAHEDGHALQHRLGYPRCAGALGWPPWPSPRNNWVMACFCWRHWWRQSPAPLRPDS